MQLKEKLKQKLKETNMTASGLAKRAGVPRQVVADWVNGTKPRNLDHVRAVASVLNISIEELVYGATPSSKSFEETDLDSLIGDGWISGLFEVKLRRIKKTKLKEE